MVIGVLCHPLSDRIDDLAIYSLVRLKDCVFDAPCIGPPMSDDDNAVDAEQGSATNLEGVNLLIDATQCGSNNRRTKHRNRVSGEFVTNDAKQSITERLKRF